MALAFRLSGEQKFAQGAIREMLVAASFRDWNPRHFLDTAEMTTALAIGYDWLYDDIPPADRQTIRQAMVEMGLEEGMKVYRSKGWWSVGDNNWNQVCNGGMILGALAGLGLGQWVRQRIDQALFRKALLFMLFVIGLNLLRRAAF